MKTKVVPSLSILLALLLQAAPLLRSLAPATQGLAPSTWAIVLKIGVGAVALLGFDAVSQASSISISPPNATAGVAYSGTVTYSGGHSGAVTSMSVSNVCLGSLTPFFDGLSIVYSGGNKATVTGTPTAAASYTFTVTSWSGGGCGGSHADSRATTLVIGASGGGNVAPTTPFISQPQNTVAQIGSDVVLSGGTSGNPVPQYQWWQGGQPIAGATNSFLTITNVQLAKAGLYTLTASNVLNASQTFGALPKANCYLSACISGGTNFTTLDYTNYAPAGVALTMFSFVTNVSTATNYYYWIYNSLNTISTSNTIPFTATAVVPGKSGTYSVFLSSTNAGPITIFSSQYYDSYWSFGYPPAFTNQLPATTNLNAGTNITLSLPLRGNFDVYAVGAAAVTNGGVPGVFWYRDSTLLAAQVFTNGPVSGTTFTNWAFFTSLTLSNVTTANAGNYTVVATNYWGSTTSSPVALSVTSSGFAPGISAQPPAGLALLAGQSSIISVTVTGTPPLSYQWRKGGVGLAEGGVYGGTATNLLTLTAVGTGNAGNYSVAITNSTGAVTSSVTAVSVSAPPTLAAASDGPGSLQLSGSTATGLTYVVLSATNLANAGWIPVVTNNTGPAGTISFQTNTAGGPQNFYRLKFP
ncbi:MAG: immunoglobulin domain-containing protein [Verrucomicrobiae bacterium]|nr:immunoglobulin domain-containing protein [Verrucomicrobiae bacterium]